MTAASPDRGAFHRGRLLRARFREPVAFALPRLAGRRICRASSSMCKTSTRPLLGRFRGARSRPHALPRFLQVDVSTSTTVDRSSIPSHGIRGRDDCHAPAGSCLLIGAAAGGARGQGPSNRCSAFPVTIARAGTWPQPRSLRAPGVARRHPPPVWSDAVGKWRCRRRARLQGAPAGRAVWRRTSAKMPGAHQPEVPSVTRTFANERTHTREPKLTDSEAGAFFTTAGVREGRPRTPAMARRIGRRG
jgi:hypothetical protein